MRVLLEQGQVLLLAVPGLHVLGNAAKQFSISSTTAAWSIPSSVASIWKFSASRTWFTAFAAWISIFDGLHPRFRHVPLTTPAPRGPYRGPRPLRQLRRCYPYRRRSPQYVDVGHTTVMTVAAILKVVRWSSSVARTDSVSEV